MGDSTYTGTTLTCDPNLGDGPDATTLGRMRVLRSIGVAAPVLAIILSFLLGGDPLARELFCTGMWLHASSSGCMLWLLRSRRRIEPRTAAVLWVIAAIGLVPALYYFGPFSSVIVVLLLGVVVVAIGKSGWVPNAVFGFAIAAQVMLAIPMIAGWIIDVGLLSSHELGRLQLCAVELLVVGFLVSGFAIGRWIRHSSTDAQDELANTRRELGDREQALVEMNLHVAHIDRPNEGRWTGRNLGGWNLGLVLGRGSMGEVYEASHPDGRDGAMKVLASPSDRSSSMTERFLREMQVVANLDSPHIVTVFDVSAPDAEVPYLVMERLRGFDLATRLREHNRLALSEVVIMLEQIARGLEVARISGVVHRDIKPQNVFFHDGTWKIFDFGVAKLLDSEGTLTGEAIVGTPHYMAPEQASETTAAVTVTHLADVYALGAIAYRCLTGRAPFTGTDLAQLVFQVVHMPPRRPSTMGLIAPSVEDVLAVALAKDPHERFSSALAFVESLALAHRGGVVNLEVPPNAWLD